MKRFIGDPKVWLMGLNPQHSVCQEPEPEGRANSGSTENTVKPKLAPTA